MQENEGDGMSEFKRAKPKPVPENWQEEVELFIEQTRDYMSSEEFERLDDPRKPIYDKDFNGYIWGGPNIEPICVKASDILAYFETFIATESVSAAFLRIWERWEKIDASGYALELPVLYDDGDLVNQFTQWWLYTYTDFPNFALNDMILIDRVKRQIDQAVIDYLRGGGIKESYAFIWEELKSTEGWFDLEGQDGR